MPAAEDVENAGEPARADHFSQARSARANTMSEDYTEMIAELADEFGEARVTDIARRLGVKHPTAIKAINRLKREGLVNSRPYRGIFLTPTGKIMAEKVRKRHRLVVDTLLLLGVPPEAAKADAEGIEHHVSDATLEAFERFIAATKPAAN